MAKVAKQGMKKRAPKAYKMPDPLPKGEVLEDIFKKKWKLGTSIGKGGFGEIYSAQPYTEKSSAKSGYSYVIKIEPHNNGPLFVEMHFYMRAAKKVDIDEFMSSKKSQSLGMPVYIGSGSHEHKGEKYRFVVMEKYGSDIWKLFLESNRNFPATTVYRIGLQILDVLEYIHSKGYIHGDIKGANILLSLSNPNQVYLVDFGLAEHYTTTAEFKPDPKRAHNGTIEFLSRDAHLGVRTRRGDLEILIYNLIQWLGCFLPWESNLKDVAFVQQSKEKYMSDIPEFLKTCFGSRTPPVAIKEYLKKLLTIKFNAELNYEKFRDILLAGLKSAGGSMKTPLEFKAPKATSKRRSDTKVSSSPGKKQKLQEKTNIKDSNNKLADSDQESDESHRDDLTAKISKRKVQKNSNHSKKVQVSSEEESNQESEDKNDNDYLPQKRMNTRKQLPKDRVKKKLVEHGSSDEDSSKEEVLKKQERKRQLRNVKKSNGKKKEENSDQEDLSDEKPVKEKKQKVKRQFQNVKKSNYDKEKEENSDQEELSDEKPVVEKEQTVKRLFQNVKKFYDNEKEENSDQEDLSDEKPVMEKKQTVKRQFQNVKKSNDKGNIDQEDLSDEKKPVKLAEEKCSDDSDMSTYTAEMRRIKNKMKALKASKPRKQRIKKNDAQHTNLLPSTSVSSDKNKNANNGDIISNSDDDEMPLAVARRKKAEK